MERIDKIDRKNLVDIYKKDGEKEVLVFKYKADDKTEEYEIQQANENSNGRRYIESNDFKHIFFNESGIFHLIEDENQLTGYDFRNCIFIIEIKKNFSSSAFKTDFNNTIFAQKIKFSRTTFAREVNFTHATFTKEIHFFETNFKQNTNFQDATFTKDASFNNAIFDKEVSFISATFSQEVNFYRVTFTQESYFSNATFIKEANFSNATFTKEANFFKATFSQEVNFYRVTFTQVVFFWEATFKQEANFQEATFTKEANFREATFTKEANFREATFKQEASFYKATFTKEVNFQNTKFEGLFYFNEINSRKKEVGFSLNLKSTVIDRIDHTDTQIEMDNTLNRETFLVLKNLAIKQNDNIKALEFHTKEMNKYYEELKSKLEKCLHDFLKKRSLGFLILRIFNFLKKCSFDFLILCIFDLLKKRSFDFLILSLEKTVSCFGTKPLRALVCLFIFNFGLYFFSLNFTWSHFFYSLDSLPTLVFPFKAKVFTWYHLVSLAGNSFLIYELQKSLRKFSRRL